MGTSSINTQTTQNDLKVVLFSQLLKEMVRLVSNDIKDMHRDNPESVNMMLKSSALNTLNRINDLLNSRS